VVRKNRIKNTPTDKNDEQVEKEIISGSSAERIHSAEELDQMIQAAKQARHNACASAIQEACQRYRCDLIPVITIIGDKIVANVQLVAKD
jgi:hypothetical protein